MKHATINDYPLLEDHGLPLPKWCILRGDEEFRILQAPYHDLFCQCLTKDFERGFEPMLNNLAGVIFEKEFPGEYLKMIRRQAVAVFKTGSPDSADVDKWARYNALHEWRKELPILAS